MTWVRFTEGIYDLGALKTSEGIYDLGALERVGGLLDGSLEGAEPRGCLRLLCLRRSQSLPCSPKRCV